MRKTYFRRKWGIRYRPGKSTKAGKVMRLKMPKVTREPSRAEERNEDRCWNSASLADGGAQFESGDKTNLIIPNSLDHDQTPCYHQGLYRIGECMGLVSPGYVGRGDQDNGQGPTPWRLDQLMNSPVLEHDT